MLRFLMIPFVFIAFVSVSQEKVYVPIDQTIFAKDLEGGSELRGSSFGGVGYFAVNTFLNVYDDNKRARQARESALGKSEILKSNYAEYDSFPGTIVDGWHDAVATDRSNFCESVQVRVANNRIVEFVTDGCIRISCASLGSIKKGKGVVTLDNFNGDKLEMVDIYFMYDMEEPKLVSEPIQPGYVCFWSKRNVYTKGNIIMNRIKYGSITSTFSFRPNPFEKGTFNMILKPGRYTVMVKKAGNDKEHTLEIKSGECLMYQL